MTYLVAVALFAVITGAFYLCVVIRLAVEVALTRRDNRRLRHLPGALRQRPPPRPPPASVGSISTRTTEGPDLDE